MGLFDMFKNPDKGGRATTPPMQVVKSKYPPKKTVPAKQPKEEIQMIDWSKYWHMDINGLMRCNRCGGEVWYLGDGYICSGKVSCFNEDDNNE